MMALLAITLTYQPQIFVFYIGEIGTILYILPTCWSYFLSSNKKQELCLNLLDLRSSTAFWCQSQPCCRLLWHHVLAWERPSCHCAKLLAHELNTFYSQAFLRLLSYLLRLIFSLYLVTSRHQPGHKVWASFLRCGVLDLIVSHCCKIGTMDFLPLLQASSSRVLPARLSAF